MIVRGIDFTSRPTAGKPITCFEGRLDGTVLRFERELAWTGFAGFEEVLKAPGPWVAGLDLPFGQARRFIERIGWPPEWRDYAAHVGSLSRDAFREALDAFRAGQPVGAKEFRRETDERASSISPQKLYGVPVALMFFEGVKRLIEADVFIPGLKAGDGNRVVVEAYPGVLARNLIGRRPYKNDDPKKHTPQRLEARRAILQGIADGHLSDDYGVSLDLPVAAAAMIAADGSGDRLDAMLCAVQAAWAWTMRDRDFGAPPGFDRREGWIADPSLLGPARR